MNKKPYNIKIIDLSFDVPKAIFWEGQKRPLSYKVGRKCLYCKEPIADHVHGLRQYCEDTELEDGSPYSCKNRHNIEKRQKREAALGSLTRFYRETVEAIEQLLLIRGDNVSLDELSSAGIDIRKALRVEQIQPERYRFYFPLYVLEMTSLNTLKITNHELTLY